VRPGSAGRAEVVLELISRSRQERAAKFKWRDKLSVGIDPSMKVDTFPSAALRTACPAF